MEKKKITDMKNYQVPAHGFLSKTFFFIILFFSCRELIPGKGEESWIPIVSGKRRSEAKPLLNTKARHNLMNDAILGERKEEWALPLSNFFTFEPFFPHFIQIQFNFLFLVDQNSKQKPMEKWKLRDFFYFLASEYSDSCRFSLPLATSQNSIGKIAIKP